nr:GGGtGRT protein [Clostridium sp. UBA1652]
MRVLYAFSYPNVEMMGLIGMGNNPMVGATVAVAVAIEEALNK